MIILIFVLDIFINLMTDIGSWEIMTLRCFGFVFGHPSNFLLYNFIVKNSPRLNINIGVLGWEGYRRLKWKKGCLNMTFFYSYAMHYIFILRRKGLI